MVPSIRRTPQQRQLRKHIKRKVSFLRFGCSWSVGKSVRLAENRHFGNEIEWTGRKTYRAFEWRGFDRIFHVQIHSRDALHLATVYFCVTWRQLGRTKRKLMSSDRRKIKTKTPQMHAPAEYFWPERNWVKRRYKVVKIGFILFLIHEMKVGAACESGKSIFGRSVCKWHDDKIKFSGNTNECVSCVKLPSCVCVYANVCAVWANNSNFQGFGWPVSGKWH